MTANEPSGELELTLRLPSTSVPLDRVVVATVELAAVASAARVSARLNLIEGDLQIDVTAAGGRTVRCAWPWPVDAAPRSVELAPGERLVAAVPLLATDTSQPLFPTPGRYELVARFSAGGGRELTSAPVPLTRTAAVDDGIATDLRDRDVLQSLLSGGVMGGAGEALDRLTQSPDAATVAFADVALERTDALAAAAGESAVALAVGAVLPPDATGPDPRRDAVLGSAPRETRAALTGTPLSGA